MIGFLSPLVFQFSLWPWVLPPRGLFSSIHRLFPAFPRDCGRNRFINRDSGQPFQVGLQLRAPADDSTPEPSMGKHAAADLRPDCLLALSEILGDRAHIEQFARDAARTRLPAGLFRRGQDSHNSSSSGFEASSAASIGIKVSSITLCTRREGVF